MTSVDVANPVMASVIEAAHFATSRMPRSEASVVWRSLSNRFPNSAEISLACVNSFFLSEDWEELDSFWREHPERCHHPVVLIRLVDYCLVCLDLPRARSALKDYLKLFGKDIAYLVRQYDLACLEHKFAAAEKLATLVEKRFSDSPVSGSTLVKKASCYKKISGRMGWAGPPTDYLVYVINLDANVERMQRISKQVPDELLRRIPGVKGLYLPETINKTLTRGAGWKLKGSIGCFLSHIAAWEAIAQSSLPYGIVLEDDAFLIAGLPKSIASLRVAKKADLLFINERMSADPPQYKPSFSNSRVCDVLATKEEDWRTPGADGYILSKRGAIALLKRVAEDGIAGDVDWRLLLYAMTPHQMGRLSRGGSVTAQALRFHAVMCRSRTPVKSGVLHPPLVRQLSGGSVRVWDNGFPAERLTHVVRTLSGRVAHLEGK